MLLQIEHLPENFVENKLSNLSHKLVTVSSWTTSQNRVSELSHMKLSVTLKRTTRLVSWEGTRNMVKLLCWLKKSSTTVTLCFNKSRDEITDHAFPKILNTCPKFSLLMFPFLLEKDDQTILNDSYNWLGPTLQLDHNHTDQTISKDNHNWLDLTLQLDHTLSSDILHLLLQPNLQPNIPSQCDQIIRERFSMKPLRFQNA